jgi:uncharacterized protein (DUF983 family)
MPGWGATIWRGIAGRCPCCGKAPIFDGYLKVHDRCESCAAPLGDMPADDTPPFIAMLVVMHLLGLCVVLGFLWHITPDVAASIALLALLVLICLVALRMAKGAVIGILLKLYSKRTKPDA